MKKLNFTYLISNFSRKNFTIDKLIICIGALALILVLVFLFWWQGDEILISNIKKGEDPAQNEARSSISGLACEETGRRPVAVMLSADPITRPLSGIGQADIVFEMPVTPSGVTRIMAVYQCESPQEIGSIRSAREDFIPLAGNFDAIYIHWGGEKEALKMLDAHVLDNLDAMKYEDVYFYRKSGTRQPHNGFTNFENILSGAETMGYELNDSFQGYPHSELKNPKNITSLIDSISIDYPNSFKVFWKYDQDKNLYYRFRNNTPEIDKINGQQVSASVIAVMETSSRYISKDYINVIVVGEGKAKIYQNGTVMSGRWNKDSANIDNKLYFFDNNGKEVEFAPGKIWVEIII